MGPVVDVDELRQRAEGGDAEAQFELAKCYSEGTNGLARDDNAAFGWYHKSAQQGNGDAQCRLAWCYENGEGVGEDLDAAIKWYRTAAAQGNAWGQFSLGWCCQNGSGVAEDLAEAVKWYRLAAEQGNGRAQCTLGSCYQNGHGVDKDPTEAVKWYRLSAEQGDADAQCSLAWCYENGEGVDKNLNEAFEWYHKAGKQPGTEHAFDRIESLAKGGSIEAFSFICQLAHRGEEKMQLFVAKCFENSWGVPADANEAFKWYRKAAEQGNTDALAWIESLARRGSEEAFNLIVQLAQQGDEKMQISVAEHYQKGYGGGADDLTEAVKWYRMAAEKGNAVARYELGCFYQYGRGVEEDLKEAVRWFRLSADQGHADAQCNLGLCYESGRGVTYDPDEAAKWYRKAAEQGNTYALRQIESLAKSGSKEAFNYISQLALQGNDDMLILVAECCESGQGVSKDLDEAAKWYRKAVEKGSTDAVANIESLAKSGSKEAFSFIAQLAHQGDERMQIFAAECCKNGWGVEKNLDAAAKWYRMAAEKGNKGALETIFELAMRGTKEALDALLALAQQNNIEAQNMVGCCYEKGKGVSRDVNEAIKWYRKAAEQGDKKALENVQYCIEYGNRDSFSCISKSTAAELSLKETSPILPIESFDSSVTNPSGLLLSPDDKLVVIFRDGYPAITVMFEAITWKEKWRQEKSNIRPQAFSPDGNFLLVCHQNSPTAAILDAHTGALVRELSGHTQQINVAAWSSSNLIATGSDDTTIRISRPDGTLVRVLTGHQAAVSYLSFVNHGNQLFSHSSHHNGVYLWVVAGGGFRSFVRDMLKVTKISPNGLLIAGVSELSALEFFQAKNGGYLGLLKFFRETTPITWSSDSKNLFAKNGQNLCIFHFTEEGLQCTSFHHLTEILAMAFLSEGDRVLTIDSGGRVQHHMCLLENASPRTPVKITASQIPLSAIPLFIPKPTQSLKEALDRTRVLIERTLSPTSFQNLQRALQCINDPSVSDISARVRTENAIEDMFAQISAFIVSESHPESAPERLKQSIAAIESAMQTLIAFDSSISMPPSLSSFSSSESNALFADGNIANVVPAALSKAELEVILRFSYNAHNKLRALEKVLSIRAASFGEAIVEYDNFASELTAKSETNSDDFAELVAQMKQMINMISASDVNDVNSVNTSTSSKEINRSAATTKRTENNQSVDNLTVDEVETDLESMILLNEIRIPVGRVNDVKVSPDGNILAIAMNRGLFVFDTRSKNELWKIASDTPQIAFSPASTQIAAAIKTEKDVVILEAMTGARVFAFDGDKGKASAVAWSNSNLIASSHGGESSILIRHPDGRVYGKYGEGIDVRYLAFSLDSTRLAVVVSDQGILVIELCNQEYYEKDCGYFRFVPKIISKWEDLSLTAFSPDGSKVVYTSENGVIGVFDSKTFETINSFYFRERVDISWSHNSRFMAVISPGDHKNDPFFKILATDGNQFGKSVFQQKILGNRVVFSPDGSEIITFGGRAGLVQFWTSPLFITLVTNRMPSADDNEIPFGQLHAIPPIDTQPVEHIFDRITTLIDRVDHPESFHRLVTLLHQIKNASATLKISESDADFLVIDNSSSSSSSSSSSFQQMNIRKSTSESMLDFVNVNGRKLLELENKLLCRADMLSTALIAYDNLVDEIRIASEQHVDKIAGFVAYLSKPGISEERLLHIRSTIASAR